jgi:hypothetical protein
MVNGPQEAATPTTTSARAIPMKIIMDSIAEDRDMLLVLLCYSVIIFTLGWVAGSH